MVAVAVARTKSCLQDKFKIRDPDLVVMYVWHPFQYMVVQVITKLINGKIWS